MAELIKFQCEHCGKILKVPKSRAGQTGKCARCKNPVTIPFPDNEGLGGTGEEIISTSSLSPQEKERERNKFQKNSEIKETLEKLSKTAVKPYPFSNNSKRDKTSTFNIPSFSSKDTKVREKESIEKGSDYYQDFLSSQSSNLDNKSQEEKKYTSSKKIEKKERIVTTKKVPKKKIYLIHYIIPLAFYILGIFVGLLLGPGYLGIIPGKDVILGISETPPEIEDDNEIINKVDSNKIDKNRTSVEIDMTKKESLSIEKRKKKKSINPKVKSKIDKALSHIENYLNVLEKKYKEVVKKREKLTKLYPGLYLPKVETALMKAQRMQLSLKYLIRKANNIEDSDKLYKFYKKKIFPYRKLNPQRSIHLSNLSKAEAEIERYLSYYRKKERKVSTKYLGTWYKKLVRKLKILNKYIKKRVQMDRGAAIRIRKIETMIKKMIKGYSRDISEIAANLKKIMQIKDVKKWIAQRRRKADSASKLRQAKIVEYFIKYKKFELDIEKELRELSYGIRDLKYQVKSGRIGENVTRKILKALQSIDRKYTEPYEDFNSAVTNLEFWEG